ncbi:hypothetical protein HYU13_04705, partial [Candidatus Woesearchaeota archaeon]|nr:hypothetical protein [Candidatus Woesearchaeota archaeon]
SELYYTVRGAKEREQLDFYNRLGAMLENPSHLHNFTSPGEIDKCQQRIDDMRENQGIPSPSVADLGGSDGAKRLFLLYTTNPSPHLKSGDAGTSGYKSESVKPSLPDCLTSDIMRNVDLGRIGGKK